MGADRQMEVQEPERQSWLLVHVDREESVVYGPALSRPHDPLEVVPRSVAEKLAGALEEIRERTHQLHPGPDPSARAAAFHAARRAVGAYRAAYPAVSPPANSPQTQGTG